MEEEKESVKKVLGTVLPITHDCHNAQYYAVQQTKHTRKLNHHSKADNCIPIICK